ncbi:AAA family ATPase [Scytonema sp. UIC 10036]|uniref:nucleoside monophosphate kinase n=1 Tax=Scytonema sp. UIC 10036 TaxID=2304196 RepID=UPI0012DADC5D|nr:nucleoside monophosphate kinase [Scytonema sp. UIC 10036]MUG94483.1 AAA family ATPase [Scytonema sp. UIC 10036]
MTQKSAVILLGSPGSGKTAIANRLASGNGVQTMEIRRLVHSEVVAGTKIGEKLKPFLNESKLVPTEIVAEVVQKRIQQLDTSVILFDGFPHQEDEISAFFDLFQEGKFDRFAVIVLEVPRELAVYRMLNRRSKRPEDKPDTVNERLDIYERDTVPVINYFQTNYPERTYFESVDKPIKQTVGSIVSNLHQVGIDIYLTLSEMIIKLSPSK